MPPADYIVAERIPETQVLVTCSTVEKWFFKASRTKIFFIFCQIFTIFDDFFTRTHFYDLLGKEVDMREKRNNVLARQLEITEVEQALRSAIKGVDEEIKVPLEKSSQCIFCF